MRPFSPEIIVGPERNVLISCNARPKVRSGASHGKYTMFPWMNASIHNGWRCRMKNLIASLSIRRPKGWKKYISSTRPVPGLLSTVAVVETDSTDLASSSSPPPPDPTVHRENCTSLINPHKTWAPHTKPCKRLDACTEDIRGSIYWQEATSPVTVCKSHLEFWLI